MSRTRALLAAAIAAAGCGKGLPSDWVTVPTRASHGFFPIATGVHAQADCSACHGSYDTFKKFDCTTSACHVQPQLDLFHAAVTTGYATDGPTCLGCHPKGTLTPPANHDTAFFPRGSGTAHGGVYCTECHKDLSTPNNPTAFHCIDCHGTLPTGWPHRDPVGLVRILVISTNPSQVYLPNNLQLTRTPIDVTNPASCLRCHADSQPNTVASHPVSSGSPSQNDTHAGAGCLTCHPAMRTDKPFGADFSATPAPGTGSGCGTCHVTQPL